MIYRIQYRRLLLWFVCTSFLVLPLCASAQSEYETDTLVEDAMEEYDTLATTYQHFPDTVIFRSTPDSAIAHWQGMKEFAYANDSEYWTKNVPPAPGKRNWNLLYLSTVLQYLLFVVFIFALVYLLYRILSDNKIVLFKRKKKYIGSNKILETHTDETDLSTLVAEAERKGQFRLAARYRYMKLLEKMNERQMIRMHGEFTNWDYVRQLGSHPLSGTFRYLTLAYEYVWYGEFELNGDQYQQLKHKFETFLH